MMQQEDWNAIDHVLLDMDGTLLDKHFDDYFWEQYLPEHYSLLHGISIRQARSALLARYRQVENTLAWTDLNYWSQELGLDIPALKKNIDHLIQIHPGVIEFLVFCRNSGKHLALVTNAHSTTLTIKLEKTGLDSWFDDIICAEATGYAKEQKDFWNTLSHHLTFDPTRTLFADDSETVLATAATGSNIRHLIHIARPSSRKQPTYSRRFTSICSFRELMPADNLSPPIISA